MRTMAIGDVRPQEQQVQDQPSSSTMVQPQLKMRNKYITMMAWIKGEHKNKKEGRRKEYHRHLQPKSAPTFKEIIRWIKFLVTLARE
jgi:hypothetical protein